MGKPKVEVTSFCEKEMQSKKWTKDFVKNVGPNDLFFELTIPERLKGKENEERLFIEKAQNYVTEKYGSTLKKGGRVYVAVKK